MSQPSKKGSKKGSRDKDNPAQETTAVEDLLEITQSEESVEAPVGTDFAELIAKYDTIDLSEQEINEMLNDVALGREASGSSAGISESGANKTNINYWSLLKLAATVKRVPAYTQYFFAKGSDMKYMSFTLRPENQLQAVAGIKLWTENKEIFMDREQLRRNIKRDPKWLYTVADAHKFWNAVTSLSATFSNQLFSRAVALHMLIPALTPVTNTQLGHGFNERVITQLSKEWEELPNSSKEFVGGEVTDEDVQHLESVLFAVMGKAVKRGKLHKKMAVFLYLNKTSDKVQRLIGRGYLQVYEYARTKGMLPGEEINPARSLPTTTT